MIQKTVDALLTLVEGIRYYKSAGWDVKRRRTTVEPFMGIVDGINFTITVEELLDNIF